MKKKTMLFLLIAFAISPIISFAENRVTGEYGNFDDAVKIVQEVMRDYYIKEDRFQYNYSRATYGLTSPEEATVQDTKHLVCASFTYSTYAEAFGVSNKVDQFPIYNYSITEAGADYYNTYKNNSSMLDGHYLLYYYKKNQDKYIYGGSDNISDFAKKIQPGDLFTYTGHAMIAYKVVERSSGKWDVLMLNSSASNLVNSRINGTSKLYYDFFPSTSTQDVLHVDKQGTVRFFWLSNSAHFSEDGKLICDKEECTVVRPFYKGANNKAIFNYSILPSNYNKSMLRTEYPGIFIEKTVDKVDNNGVYLNDELTYTVNIKNVSNSTGSGSNYGEFYIVENLGNEVEYVDSTNGVLSDNKLVFKFTGLNVGEVATLTYKVKVKNNLNNVNKVITSTGEFKKNLDDNASITTGTVENKIIPKSDSQKKAFSECYNENKDSKTGLTLINEIYKCSHDKDFKFNEFSFENLFTKKVIKGKGTANAIVFNTEMNSDSKVFKKMILNDLWSGIVELDTNPTDEEDSASDDDGESTYTLPRWSGDVASTRARNINPNFFKDGDVLIYSVDYSNTADNLKHTKENGVYAYIFLNGKFVGVNGSGNTSRNEFTYKYYEDKSLAYKDHLYSGYDKLTDSHDKAAILKTANYQTLFDKDYYVILRPEQAIKELIKISVSKKPDKTVYHPEDNKLELEGGEITCYYNDGSTKAVPMDNNSVTVSGFDVNELGEHVLTVKYGGKTTTFKVTVEEKAADGEEPTDDEEQVAPIPNTSAYRNRILTILAFLLIGTGTFVIGKQVLVD